MTDACFECGARATERHHVVPQSRGGTATVPLCGRCHGLVHDIPRADDHSRLVVGGLIRARENGARLGRPPQNWDDTPIDRIHTMRLDRMTMQEIADQLNAEGITTPGGAIWRATTIRRVLNRRDVTTTSTSGG